jgi:hypothetical protein
MPKNIYKPLKKLKLGKAPERTLLTSLVRLPMSFVACWPQFDPSISL